MTTGEFEHVVRYVGFGRFTAGLTDVRPWQDITEGDETVWPPPGGSPVPAR